MKIKNWLNYLKCLELYLVYNKDSNKCVLMLFHEDTCLYPFFSFLLDIYVLGNRYCVQYMQIIWAVERVTIVT